MSAGKTLNVYKLLADVEGAYGTPGTITDAADAIQVAEQPTIDTEYEWDGERPPPPGTLGAQIGLAPQGAWYNPSFRIEDKGAGAAYSASVFPKDSHVFFQASGMDAVGSFTGGSEKYTYTPTPGQGAPKSCSYEAHGCTIPGGNTEKWIANGVYTDWVYEAANGAQAFWTFNTWGRRHAAPAEVAWVVPTYATVNPPIAAPLVLTINAVATLLVRSATVRANRQVTSRFPDMNQTGQHPGFQPGDRRPELVFVCEAPAFATLNLHSLRDAATGFAASFQIGIAQYNRRKWTFAQAQVKNVRRQAADKVPLLEVTCRLYNSTPNANDDISCVVD